jgi:hypothetical protein
VAEDAREFYAENRDFDWSFRDLRDLSSTVSGLARTEDPRMETPRWLVENVKPHLRGPRMEVATMREEIKRFLWGDSAPSFWGYMCAYDWVVFCWIFGRMADKPESFPYYCNDLAQYMDMMGVERDELPSAGAHNALADARWNKYAFERIRALNADRAFAVLPAGAAPTDLGWRQVRAATAGSGIFDREDQT